MKWTLLAVALGAMACPVCAASWKLSPEREVVLEGVWWDPLHGFSHFSLSPDGRWFVLFNRHEFRKDAWKGICLWETAHGELKECITIPGFDANRDFLSPTIWAPDGSAFAVVTSHSGSTPKQRLWVVYPETGKVVELLSWKEASLRNLAWSPDGKRLALAICDGNGCTFELLSLNTAERTPVARCEEAPEWIFWTRDNRLIWGLVPPDGAEYQVFELDLEDGGGPELVWSSSESLSLNHHHALSPDGRYLWVAPKPELIDLTSGEAIPLCPPGDEGYPGMPVSSLVWSPSREQCLYSYLYAGEREKKSLLLLGTPGSEGLSIQVLMERPPGFVLAWSADDRVWLGRWEEKGTVFRLLVFKIFQIEGGGEWACARWP